MDEELNVSALCERLKAPQSRGFHHLGILKPGGLVTTRRRGKEIHYSPRDFMSDRSGQALESILAGSDHIQIGPFVLGVRKA